MKRALLFLFSFCVFSPAYAAEDCLDKPTCSELGYTQLKVWCSCVGREALPCPFNVNDSNHVFCGDVDCREKCKTAYPLFAGQDNTKAAIDQLGNKALAAYAASQFYVGDKDGDFGQGKWYLPSIGEWMYFLGTDMCQMTKASGYSGATNHNKPLINNALNTLAGKGVDAKAIEISDRWSSSESDGGMWFLQVSGTRVKRNKILRYLVRCSLFLRDIFDPSAGGTAPKIGDVMYLDKTWGSAADYDGSKTAAGIIAAVSADGRDATLINLNDLTFKSYSGVENFDPDNPYSSSSNTTQWATDDKLTEDITGIPNFDDDEFFEAAKASVNCPCMFYGEESSCDLTAESCAAESKIFNDTSCACEACPSGFVFENGVCVADLCSEKCKTAYPLFAGESNTKAILDQFGNKALVAYAASQFYVGDKNGDFGQGKWYVPSIGEWIHFYGIDTNKITVGADTNSGATGDNKKLIYNALSTLKEKGAEAETLGVIFEWLSSEYDSNSLWQINLNSGYRYGLNLTTYDTHKMGVRFYLLLKDCFDPSSGGTAPKIGDVMYKDKTYGAAADYDGSKVPVGVVSSVSKDGSDVTIINLKDFGFSSSSAVNNFDPEDPYGGAFYTQWFAEKNSNYKDVSGISNADGDQFLELIKVTDNCPCQFYPPE